MLTLTEDARLAILSLTATDDPGVEPGVRIAAAAGHDGQDSELAMSVTADPAAGDAVVEEDGARVFLDATAARLLDAATLDVQIDPDARQVNFYLA